MKVFVGLFGVVEVCEYVYGLQFVVVDVVLYVVCIWKFVGVVEVVFGVLVCQVVCCIDWFGVYVGQVFEVVFVFGEFLGGGLVDVLYLFVFCFYGYGVYFQG